MKKTFSIALAIMIGFLLCIGCSGTGDNSVDLELETITDSFEPIEDTGAEVQPERDIPTPESFTQDIYFLPNLILKTDFSVPDELFLFESSYVSFSQSDVDTLAEILEQNGWQGIYGETYDTGTFSHLLLYQDTNYSEPVDKQAEADREAAFQQSPEHDHFADMFLNDSGIVEWLLHQYGVELSTEGANQSGAAGRIFRGVESEFQTDSWLNLIISPHGTIAEARLLAFKYDNKLAVSDILSVEEAIANAFLPMEFYGYTESDINELIDSPHDIIEISIVYRRGIPFYKFTMQISNDFNWDGYSLAIPLSLISQNEHVENNYMGLMSSATNWQS